MPSPDLARRQPRVRAVRLRIGRGTLVLPPLGIVLLVLVGPIVVLALYSVNLRTNIPGTPTALSGANWNDFLTGRGNPFRAHALVHHQRAFTHAHFERWLSLFHDTVELGWTGPNARTAIELAENVARVHSSELIGAPVPYLGR